MSSFSSVDVGSSASAQWVVGEPVDVGYWNPARTDIKQMHYIDRFTADGSKPFVFLSIFKWEERKVRFASLAQKMRDVFDTLSYFLTRHH